MTLLPSAPEFLRGVTTPRVLTLLYHRINDLASDPQLLAVKPANFEQHLTILRDSYGVAKFESLAGQASLRTTSTNTVIVTFDDGYADNLTEALPLLKRFDVPATIFVTTGIIQNRKRFWWDELDSIILGPHKLPQFLELELDRIFNWDLGDDAEWSKDRHQSLSHWSLLEEADPSARHVIYRQISGYLRGATENERDTVLDYLSNWASLAMPSELKCQALSAADLLELRDSDLLEVGSHTVHHPVLSKLSPAEQTRELAESKAYLEDVMDRKINSFAYPYGTKSDFTKETVALVRNADYSAACVNIPEVTWPGTDRFQIPRLLVRDCDGDTFAQWIGEWFGQC